MGYTTSTVHGIEVPDSSEANDIPEDIGKVVTALEGGSIVRRLTGAQIAALTAPQKPAGLVVYNTTTGKLQISDGTNFANVGAPSYAIGTASSGQSLAVSTDVTITYGAETDPLSILNTGTGVITLPSAGLWQVSAYLQVSGSTTGGFATLWHNSTEVAMQDAVYMSLSALIYVAASDTVKMSYYNTSASTKTVQLARLAVAKIGT
jgi:hypothetical protein